MSVEKKCEGKLNAEANEKVIGGGIYSKSECKICDGYKVECENYSSASPWRGKD